MKKALVFMIIVALAVSCSKSESKREALRASGMSMSYDNKDEPSFDEERKPPRSAEPAPRQQDQSVEQQKKSKIIKDGSITLEVDSLELAKLAIDSIVSTTNAYYENEVYNGGANQHRYTLKIRVPNSEFETFISSLEKGGGKMISKSINARDVTGEYIDLEIRLKNNQAYLLQYRALLKRAKSIKDILEIEEKARRIESEIDAHLGRIKYINDQVKYSTLTLNVYQKHINRNDYREPTFLSRMWSSIGIGFNAMQEMVLWMIAFWPFLMLFGGAYAARRMYKGRQKKEIH